MAVHLRLNPGFEAAVLKSAAVAAAVHTKAEEVAGHARSRGIRVEDIPGDIALPVEVEDFVDATAGASVVVAHPSGEAVQAKHGLLTASAAAAGLEVRGG